MSRIPNPFLGSEVPPKPPQPQSHTPAGPGFLLMTRPPTASFPRSRGGRGAPPHPSTPLTHSTPLAPAHRHALSAPDSFIPFSNNSQDGGRRGGRGGGGFSLGRGRGQGSPRPYSPYHPSQARGGGDWSMGSPGHNQAPHFTPVRSNTNRDAFRNPRQRFSFNGSARGGGGGGGGGGRDRGPISDIPVEKFVSPSMVRDPWAEFDIPAAVSAPDPLKRTATLPLLDDSEIVIDSDTSVVVENSYEGGVSGTEGDSSPVPDTGSDSPYVATSSTSDKDGASDSTGDD